MGEKFMCVQACVRALFSGLGGSGSARGGNTHGVSYHVLFYFFWSFSIQLKDVDMDEWREV